MYHQPTDSSLAVAGRFENEANEQKRSSARAAFRRSIRARIPGYRRKKLIPTLIYCPADWLEQVSLDVCDAILRRLKLALYQQRQARAVNHYTYSLGRYTTLLVAIGGELRFRNSLLGTKALNSDADLEGRAMPAPHPAGKNSRLEIPPTPLSRAPRSVL